MTQDEAVERLGALCAATSDPKLTDDDLLIALAAGSLADANGLQPTDTLWSPTYDLNRAAAQGWELKAGKAASDVDFQDAGGSYQLSQVVDHCTRMAARYRSRRMLAVVEKVR